MKFTVKVISSKHALSREAAQSKSRSSKEEETTTLFLVIPIALINIKFEKHNHGQITFLNKNTQREKKMKSSLLILINSTQHNNRHQTFFH